MTFIYTLLFHLAIPFILLRLWWRKRQLPHLEQRILERFGYYRTPDLAQCIWIHAVSYGETVAAEPLIKALIQELPTHPIVVTNMTPSGASRVKQTLNGQVTQYFVPYDLPYAIKRFLKHTQPKIAILMETELWPNTIAQCHQSNIPLLLANARLSAKSLRHYHYVRGMAASMLMQINIIAAQSRHDAKRLTHLGANYKSVHITGNMKFDTSVPDTELAKAKTWLQQLPQPRPIWIAASTHEGEEALLLQTAKDLLKTQPNTLFIIVPRHPQRFHQVEKLCLDAGLKTITRRSGLTPNQETQVMIGDTMGELFFYYAIADIAFVAGSLLPIGGHNFLEAVAVETPVIIGPHFHNFLAVTRLFNKKLSIQQVTDQQALTVTLSDLFKQPDLRLQMSKGALAILKYNQGSVVRHVNLVKKLLASK